MHHTITLMKERKTNSGHSSSDKLFLNSGHCRSWKGDTRYEDSNHSFKDYFR